MADSTVFKTLVLKKPFSKSSLSIDPWLLIVLACFAVFAWACWAKIEWPNIDVGREVETSARIADGQLLYRDVDTYYTPLGYYANAIALLLFGHHLEVFYAVGLLLALIATLLFYHLSKQLMNAPWAALCTICFVLYCAIGPTASHFIVPYSYGSPYAIVFCLCAFTFLDRYAVRGQLHWLVAAAIACGLAGLAKQEYGVAALGAILVGASISTGQSLRTKIERNILVLVTAGISALLPIAFLAEKVSWQKIYLSLFPVSKASVFSRNVYMQISPGKTLSAWWFSFLAFVTISLVVWSSLIVARWLSKSKWIDMPAWVRSLLEVFVSTVFSVFVLYRLNPYIIQYIPGEDSRPLVSLSWSLPILVGWFAIARPRSSQERNAVLLWALLIFSLLLNARWGFYIRCYGLYAVTVVMLFFLLLYRITRQVRQVHAAIFTYLLVCLLIGSGMQLNTMFGKPHYKVQSSYGTFYTRDHALATAFNQTLDFIKASKASSVLTLPDGSLLNFLSATHSPSSELTFLPPVLPTAEDEQAFISCMQANPPKLIIYVPFVPNNFSNWGYQSYADFNPIVDRWMTQQHQLVGSFPPTGNTSIQIYASD